MPLGSTHFGAATKSGHQMTRWLMMLLTVTVLSVTFSQAQTLPGYNSRQFRIERVGENHVRLIGAVEIEQEDWKFYADELELFTDTHELIASGNVVYATATNRIAAERVEFNTETKTGTFYVATGTASISGRVERSLFGTQEPDAYFYGESIEKIGPDKYRINRGGFTTCVQPTPRWELTSGSIIVNLDDYVVLKNMVLNVKGVPLFYLPIMYYPLQEDDRATGFLMPGFGSSTYRGRSLSNAFFWAISRSQDVTLMHDYFSVAGQGLGAEYRYILSPGSQGTVQTYFLNQPAVSYPGASTTTAAKALSSTSKRSFHINGNISQSIGSAVQIRGRADFFSDVTVQQTFQTNILQATQRSRRVAGNATARIAGFNTSTTVDWAETYFGDTQSTVNGARPRIRVSSGEKPIPGLPLYVSLSSEYASVLRQGLSKKYDADGLPAVKKISHSTSRFHINPTLRIPFTKWQFMTLNSSVSWHGTYWTKSFDYESKEQIESGIDRRYFEFYSRFTGPVFAKVWDTPNSSYAERFKHVIEPSLSFQRTTAIDNFDEILKIDGIDSITGGRTRISYGVTNRFLARRRAQGDAREVLSIAMLQNYYTDAQATQYDRRFSTSFNGTTPAKLTPVSLIVRGSPTNQVNATLRTEYDTRYGAFRTISADGTVSLGDRFRTTGGWSQRRFVEGLSGFNNRNSLTHFINSATTFKILDNRVGGVYNFNYDVQRRRFLQQRILAYYNAQCCGITVEYQSFNFMGLSQYSTFRNAILVDRRFNISFTMAGLGTFSNFFGIFGGAGQQ